MEVMSSPPQHDRPFTERIASNLIRLEMGRKPDGQPCTVRFRWCSVYFVSEYHDIGGERRRYLDHNDELEGQEVEVAHPVHGSPAVLRSKSACRGAIRELLAEVLPALIQDSADTKGVQFWDELVPANLVESIVGGAEGGESYACDVWMHVEMKRVYNEAEELLLLCEATAVALAPSSSDAARPGAPGAGDACAICMEEVADAIDGVTVLPGCSHAFHRECILKWFGKAPTCPCCRRDMITTSIEDS